MPSAGLTHFRARDSSMNDTDSPPVKMVEYLCDIVALAEFLTGLQKLSFVKCTLRERSCSPFAAPRDSSQTRL